MAHDSQYYCYSLFYCLGNLHAAFDYTVFVVLLIVCYYKGLSIFICTLLLPFVSTTATQWPCHINHLHNGSPYLLIVGHMIIESNTPTQNYVLCGGFSKTNSFGLLPKYYLWIFMAFDGTFFVDSVFLFICCVLCMMLRSWIDVVVHHHHRRRRSWDTRVVNVINFLQFNIKNVIAVRMGFTKTTTNTSSDQHVSSIIIVIHITIIAFWILCVFSNLKRDN